MRISLRSTLILTALTWALAVQAASDAAQGYRLAGIIAAGQDHLGLLEVPTGGQVLVRAGSTLPGGAKVRALSDRHVEIVLANGQRLELALSGLLGRPPAPAVAAVSPPTVPSGIVTTTSRAEGHSMRQVALTPFRSTLHAPVKAVDSTANATPSNAVVAQRFTALLELPAGARILEVNGKPVRDAATAVNIAERSLSAGKIAAIKVQSNQGVERIYLQPEAVP